MKLKKLLNSSNIKSFIKGNYYYLIDRFNGYPKHKKEQVLYRLAICRKDCVPTGQCIICDCPPKKKAFVNKSCNPDRFPDMMEKEEWEQFKKENKIKTE